MKLTQRGKDYLKASLIGVVAASVFDVKLVIVLCFALIVAAGISEFALVTASSRNIQIVFENEHISCFKGENAREKVRVISRRRRLISVSVFSMNPPEGIESRVEKQDGDSMTFVFHPKYAGRFSGLTAKFELKDPLELFSKYIEVKREDFIIDCYPAALLKEIRTTRPVTLALGERAGRTHGTGQEFYSIDEYKSGVERKNIFWKKIASMPDERLLVKIRESNIPRTLSIGFIKTDGSDVDDLRWNDLACEGAGLIGKIILSIGCDVQILFGNNNGIARKYSSEISELSDALMEMSNSSRCSVYTNSEIVSESDICLTGLRELQKHELLATMIARKPALLIEDEENLPSIIGDIAVIFDGNQDVGELVNRVVGK